MALAIRKVSNSIQAKAKPEAQLGDSETESKEPRRVGCGNLHQIPHPSTRLNLFNLLGLLGLLGL